MDAYLSLKVEQPESLKFDGGLGTQVSSEGPGQVLQLLDAVSNTSL